MNCADVPSPLRSPQRWRCNRRRAPKVRLKRKISRFSLNPSVTTGVWLSRRIWKNVQEKVKTSVVTYVTKKKSLCHVPAPVWSSRIWQSLDSSYQSRQCPPESGGRKCQPESPLDVHCESRRRDDTFQHRWQIKKQSKSQELRSALEPGYSSHQLRDFVFRCTTTVVSDGQADGNHKRNGSIGREFWQWRE